jgi:hypothetical protein
MHSFINASDWFIHGISGTWLQANITFSNLDFTADPMGATPPCPQLP